MESSVPSARTRVGEVARLFLKLGLTAFGGPAAHIGLLEEETVRRRGWLSRQEFLDLLGATNLIPGPNSTEMCIHLGYRRAGVPGLFAAGACFILPAALITGTLAWIYRQTGTLPEVEFLLYGIKPIVLAIILVAIVRLARTAFKDAFLVALAVAVAALSFAGGSEILLLLGGGAIGALRVGAGRLRLPRRPPGGIASCLLLVGVPGAATAPAGAAGSASLLSLGLFFLKVGSVLYGTGYVLLAFIQNGLVVHRQWITQTELLDAVAVGQFTPGPLLSTASFVGYLVLGWAGAVVATVGVFLPSFVLVWITHRWVSRLRASPVLAGFLDAVNVAAVGLMATVIFQLGRDSLVGWFSWTLALLALPAVLWTRVNPTWWIIAGGALGFLSWSAGILS